jgi:cell division protein FtsB
MMSISNNTVVIVGLGLGLVAIMGVGGFVMYSNVNNQLVSTQSQLQQLQKERDEIKKQIDEKDKEIKDKDKEIEKANGNTMSSNRDAQQYRAETQTVSACLKGVIQAISYKDDQARVIYALGKVEDKCEAAGKIIKRIEDREDEQQRPAHTSNIGNN